MTEVLLNWDNNTFVAPNAAYVVEDEPGKPYTIESECYGTFRVYTARGVYFGNSVEFDENDLPTDWEEIQEEVKSQIELEYR